MGWGIKFSKVNGNLMIYNLPLLQPIGSFKSIDLDKTKQLKEKLESIVGFEKLLSYYNENICSLSTFSMDGNIYFEWGNPNQNMKIYCGCKKCRSLPEFKLKNEQIFFILRAKEVNRLVTGISNAATYHEKLEFLFNNKGYTPDHTPQVFKNIPFDGNKKPDFEIWDTVPIVDLVPTTQEGRETYNQFVRKEFDKVYKNGDEFSKAYKGFDFKKEKERLHSALKNGIDSLPFLQLIKKEIEGHFNYPNSAEVKENYITKKINEKIDSESVCRDLFTKMVWGIENDLNRIVLNSHELLSYTHISEIVLYYKYVNELINKPNKTKEISKGTGTGKDSNEKTLSKLTHLLQLYYEKGCKPLTKPQVEKLAIEKNITKVVLVNRWNSLKAENYMHNGNINNVKEFIKSYQLLMQAFKGGNEKAFRDIKNHYEQLKETYPDLTY